VVKQMKLGFQFHADPSEVFAAAMAWERDFRLLGAAEVLERQEWRTPLSSIAHSNQLPRRIALHPNNLQVSEANSLQSFMAKNREALVILVGRVQRNTLQESFLSAVVEDNETARLWQRLIRKFRGSMNKGAWVKNVKSGAESWDASHRYTRGAAELAGSGVRILGGTDWLEYRFDEEI
jgi:hypothetical protein